MYSSLAGATEGFDQWLEHLSDVFVPLTAHCTDKPRQFQGSIASSALGKVVVAEVAASSCVIDRTPTLIRRDDHELYKLGLQVSGESVIEQRGRQAHLKPGDLGIFDTSQPYRITFSRDFKVTAAIFPRSLLSLPEGQMSELTAVRLAGNTGPSSLTAALLRGLNADLSENKPVIASYLGDAVIDLVTAMFAHQMHLTPNMAVRSSRRQLVARVNQFIDDNLQDPGLNTALIADAHFVSIRLLQKTFEAEGTSVSALIRSRRLERCRLDLANPSRLDLSIAQVGYRWGLPNPAHFSRAFHDTYGVSPRDFRKCHLVPVTTGS